MIIELTDEELALARIALRAYRNELLDACVFDIPTDVESAQRLHDRMVRDVE